jgi:subtilisin-like proprotein convertase family protein
MLSSQPWVLEGPAPAFGGQVDIPPNDPVSGAIQVAAPSPSNPNVVYLGAVNGGVWKTTNATASSPHWTPLTDSLPGQSITSMSLDTTDASSQTLVVGTGRRSSDAFEGDDEVGLYYTTNGGSTWSQFNQPILRDQAFYGVAARGSVILAGSATNGIYRSTDRGGSWTLVSGTNGLPTGGIFDLVGDPGFSNRFYAGVDGGGVFRTDDAGATWTDVSTGITGATSAVNMRIGIHDSINGNVVYVGEVDFTGQLSGVFRSTDKGASWTAMDVPSPSIHPGQQGDIHFSLAASPTNPNVVFVGGDRLANPPYTGNIWRGNASLAHGSQFTTIVDAGGGNTSPHADSRYLGFDANGNLLEGDDGGFYRRSTPLVSGSWGSAVGNLALIEAHDVAWDSISHTAFVGTQDNGTIQQRPPAGTTTWDLIAGGDGGDVAVDNLSLSSINRAIRYFSYYNLLGFERDVIDASNNVINTTFIDTTSISDSQFYTPIKLNAVDPLRLLVGGSANLYESFNQGDLFTNLGGAGANGDRDPLVYGGRSGGVANPDLIYAGSGNKVYKRTTAGGPITATSPLPAGASTILDITVDPNEWSTVFAIDDSHVYMSLNAGSSWTNVTGSLPAISSLDFHSLQFVPGLFDSSVVVGTRSGVFASEMSSIGTWGRVGTALPDVLVSDLDYNAADDVLVAGTLGRSVWSFSSASTELNPEPPSPGDGTFQLHSNITASKKIYLDFDGQNIRNTPWNGTDFGNIINLPFSLDGDLAHFSSDELDTITSIWERVSEDFSPFDVDVTTEDPGLNAIKNTGGNDNQWGQRVVIGGKAADWYTFVTGSSDAMAAISGSFGGQVSANPTVGDTMAFVFSDDLAASASTTTPLDKVLAEVVSHVLGTTLGLDDAGQTITNPNAPPPFITAVYPGHGSAATGWESIMGTAFNNSLGPDPNNGAIPGFDKELTQWSQGEYQFANPIQDELGAIASTLSYRADDHPDTIATANALGIDADFSTTNETVFFDEGIIGEHPSVGVSDVDMFSFTVDGLGGILNLDVSPFDNGPNLDILAKIWTTDSSGTPQLLFTSNPRDDLEVGGQTLGDASVDSNGDPDGGWLDANTGEYTDTLYLQPGAYYVSVEGTGRPFDLSNPASPDWGYTNYGSLGYYSIDGVLEKGLVVGVDFDALGGEAPTNWNQFTGSTGTSATLTNMISEAGLSVPYQLSISTTGSSLATTATTGSIDPADLPTHAVPLDALDGYLAAQNQTLTFTWSNLDPWSFHEIYIFGHADFAAHNVVTITGGNLNGTVQAFNFTQVVAPDGLEVNDLPVGNDDLSLYAKDVLSDGSGQISITVTNEAGFQAGVAGLAIVPIRPIGPPTPGSISGEKWNDVDGNRNNDPGEVGLPGWTIYIDENNNGQLDSITTPDQPDQTVTKASPDLPQTIQDYTTIKSDLVFPAQGSILDVNVALDITHTYDSDLHVTLISPSGTQLVLFANIGPNQHNFHNTVLDDSATTSIVNGVAPYTGTYRPQNPLSLFNGEQASGKWTLQIEDDSAGDTGVLNGWSLTIKVEGQKGTTTFLEPYTVTDDSGNYSFPNLDPGVYYIREYTTPDQQAAGWQPTWAPTPMTITSGADIQDVDFGNWIPAAQRGSIQGQVFYDANQNGAKDGGEPGRAGWTVYIDSNNNGVRDVAGAPTVIPATDLPKPIEDFKTTTSHVTVGSGTVLNVAVTLDITHSFVGDLSAYLVGPPTAANPTGRVVTLFNGVGGQYNDFHSLTLSDGAARSITTIGVGDLPYTGTWRPEGTLSDFAGDEAAGTWTLVVSDNVFADEGTLNSWSLSIISGETFTTTDANGNYAFNNLLAGQYVVREELKPGFTLFPPATTTIPGATWNGTKWTATIDGVSVVGVTNANFGNYGPAPVGDYNRNNSVDAADYILWRKTSGSTVPSFSVADGDGNGVIQQADYNIWRGNFGWPLAASGSGSGTLLDSPGAGAALQNGDAVAREGLALRIVQSDSVIDSSTVETLQSQQVVSGSSVATVTASLQPAINFMELTPSAVAAVVPNNSLAIDSPVQSTAASELGLMAWLASSSDRDRPQADESSADSGFTASTSGDEPESLDAAFETLESGALVAAAI